MGKRKLKEMGGSSKRYIRNTADIPALYAKSARKRKIISSAIRGLA